MVNVERYVAHLTKIYFKWLIFFISEVLPGVNIGFVQPGVVFLKLVAIQSISG